MLDIVGGRMRLIHEIKITDFRSCKDVHLKNVTDFTVLMGVNNTGKSNILRAINAFFNNEIEDGVPVDVMRDSNVRAGRKKEFSVEIKFVLPEGFVFHKKLVNAEVEKGLFGDGNTERQIWIRKRWGYNAVTGETDYELHYKSNDDDLYDEASSQESDNATKIERFLDLINLTYVPSHRDPGLIIRNAEKRIRDLLVHNYNLKKNVHRGPREKEKDKNKGKGKREETDILKEIASGATQVIEPLTEKIKEVFTDITDVKIRIPEKLHDIALVLGYEAHTKSGRKIEFNLQGSGFQTQLMFLILELADTSYLLDFGWKQATIWCLEEPESFLHWDLEGELASHFRTIVEDPKKKLQIISSTHSGPIALHGFNGYYLSTATEKGYTTVGEMDSPELVHTSCSTGVSGLIHALTLHKYSPIVLVEGISDELILRKASQELGLSPAGPILSLKSLEKDPLIGGGETIYEYLKRQAKLFSSRPLEARVIVVLDPDKKSSEDNISKFFKSNHPSSKCYVINARNRNPELDLHTFKGIEQFLSTRLIELGANNILKLARPIKRGQIKYVLQNVKEFSKNKRKLAELVVKEGAKDDFHYLKQDLEIIKNLSEGKSTQLTIPKSS